VFIPKSEVRFARFVSQVTADVAVQMAIVLFNCELSVWGIAAQIYRSIRPMRIYIHRVSRGRSPQAPRAVFSAAGEGKT